MARVRWLALGVGVIALGCAKPWSRTADLQESEGGERCRSCHGSEDSPWPPQDTLGNTSTVFRGVGSHDIHLSGSDIADPVPCESCHRVPLTVYDAGHLDSPLPAEVVFGGLAVQGGAGPSLRVVAGGNHGGKKGESGEEHGSGYDAQASVKCENVYCHGATLSGGNLRTPLWNGTTGELEQFARCDSCHGYPPPSPHPQTTACGLCHTETATKDGGIEDTSKHIDGKLEVAGSQGCNSCHGSGDNPAPPKDLHGNSDTTTLGVGAHQSHLGSDISSPVPCEECHVVPSSVDAPSHLDGDNQAEVTFGDLASSSGAKPSWVRSSATCSGVYCHGATLQGGSLTTPNWTVVNGSQAACGNCHGIPPPTGRHPSVWEKHSFMGKNCTYCHDDRTNEEGTEIVEREGHVDGVVQVGTASVKYDGKTKTCTPVCHGPKNWASGSEEGEGD